MSGPRTIASRRRGTIDRPRGGPLGGWGYDDGGTRAAPADGTFVVHIALVASGSRAGVALDNARRSTRSATTVGAAGGLVEREHPAT